MKKPKQVNGPFKGLTVHDQTKQGTLVNRVLPSLHGGSLKSTRTLPLKEYKLSYKYILFQGQMLYVKEWNSILFLACPMMKVMSLQPFDQHN